MEVGWSELLVIAVVALVIIGPKDLPEMFRTMGRFTAKLRSMAREFSRAMEDAAKESGVKDVADDLRKVTSPKSMGLDAVKSAADKFEKWDPLKSARGTTPAAAGGVVKPAAAGAGIGSAAEAAAIPDPNAPAAPPVTPGPHTADLALKRAEREAIAREAAERLRNTPPPVVQSAADAFEDAPATVIAPAVTSTPLEPAPAMKAEIAPAAKAEPAPAAKSERAADAKPAAKAKAAAAKSEPKSAAKTKAKAATKATPKAAAKPAAEPAKAKRAAKPKAAKAEAAEAKSAAKAESKRRAPEKKTAAKTAAPESGPDEAKDQA